MTWEFANPDRAQDLQFKLRLSGTNGWIANPTLEINRTVTCVIPVEVRPGQTLMLEKEALARLYDAKGNQIKSVPLSVRHPSVQAGANQIQFDCEFQGEIPPKVLLTFKTLAPPLRVGAKR